VSKVGGRFTGDTKQPAEMVEAQVQERLPHLSLVDPAGYEGKGLPAWWHCALHDCRFQAPASALVHPNAVGCPGCVEGNRREKRRARFADTDLERHLGIIRRERDDTRALIYRLRCELTGEKTHDREVGACYLDDGTDIGAAIIAEGLARDCPRFSGGRHEACETEKSRTLPLPGYCRSR